MIKKLSVFFIFIFSAFCSELNVFDLENKAIGRYINNNLKLINPINGYIRNKNMLIEVVISAGIYKNVKTHNPTTTPPSGLIFNAQILNESHNGLLGNPVRFDLFIPLNES